MQQKVCTSLKKQITNIAGTVQFLCPKCGKGQIVRSKEARKQATKYRCPECGFVGPN